MMIDFSIQKPDKLVGGLTIQIMLDRTGYDAHSRLTDLNYHGSIVISEDAFYLIEPVFVAHIAKHTVNERKRSYYHYGLNYHGNDDLQLIVNDLTQLKQDIEQCRIPNIPATTSYTMSKKIKKILTIPRIRYKYQPKMICFLQQVIDYLNLAIEDDDVKGIWVMGI